MRLRILLSVSTLAALSCTSAPSNSVSGDGANAPKASAQGSGTTTIMHISDGHSGYQLPTFEEKTFPNGLRVLFIPDDKLPYISFSLLVQSGSTRDPEGQEGLSSFVAELIDKGTAKRSASKIAQDLGDMGADFEASSSYDYSLMSASAVSAQGTALLNNFVEIVTQPAFSDGEVERMRKQFVAQIERRVDSPESFSDLAFAEYLYGSHPYGRSANGTKASIESIRKKHIIRYYLSNYRPNNSILAVVGQYTPEFKAAVEQAFLKWEKHEVTPLKYPPIEASPGLSIELVEKPDLSQTQIRMGHIGIRRQNEDFLPLRVANTILGGAFASRLNTRIRKELGLTYNISSVFDARQDPGPFEIETFTKNSTTGQTVAETLQVLKLFHDKGVVSEEVERAKGYLKGVFPTAIETPEKLALNLLLLRSYGIPDSYLTHYLHDVDALSVSDVNRAIQKHIDPAHMKIVVYSTAGTLDQLKAIPGLTAPIVVKGASEIQ